MMSLHTTTRTTAVPSLVKNPLPIWEFWHYIQILRKWFWLLCIGTLLAGLVSYTVNTYLVAPRYRATTTLMVRTIGMTAENAADSRFNDYDTFLANEYMAVTFQQLAQTRPVLDAAAQRVGLSSDQLSRALSINLVPKTPLFQLSYESRYPDQTSQIANDVALTIIDFAEQEAWIPGRELVVVEAAVTPDRPVSPRVLLNTFVAAILGAFLLLGIVFLREYLDFVGRL